MGGRANRAAIGGMNARLLDLIPECPNFGGFAPPEILDGYGAARDFLCNSAAIFHALARGALDLRHRFDRDHEQLLARLRSWAEVLDDSWVKNYGPNVWLAVRDSILQPALGEGDPFLSAFFHGRVHEARFPLLQTLNSRERGHIAWVRLLLARTPDSNPGNPEWRQSPFATRDFSGSAFPEAIDHAFQTAILSESPRSDSARVLWWIEPSPAFPDADPLPLQGASAGGAYFFAIRQALRGRPVSERIAVCTTIDKHGALGPVDSAALRLKVEAAAADADCGIDTIAVAGSAQAAVARGAGPELQVLDLLDSVSVKNEVERWRKQASVSGRSGFD